MATLTRGYNNFHVPRGLTPAYIRLLPRFADAYILDSSPVFHSQILTMLHNALLDIISLLLVNKAFARHICVFNFKGDWLVFKAKDW